MNKNIKRMLTTTDFDKRTSMMNLHGDEQSNDNNGGQSVKQQIDVFSNLNEPTNFDNFASVKKEKAKETKS